MNLISRIKFSSLIFSIIFSFYASSFSGLYQEDCKLYENAKKKKAEDSSYQLGAFEKGVLAMGVFYDFKEDGTYTKRLGQNLILQKAGLLEENKKIMGAIREKGRWTINKEAKLITLKKRYTKTYIKIFEEKGDKLEVRISTDTLGWKKVFWEKI